MCTSLGTQNVCTVCLSITKESLPEVLSVLEVNVVLRRESEEVSVFKELNGAEG